MVVVMVRSSDHDDDDDEPRSRHLGFHRPFQYLHTSSFLEHPFHSFLFTHTGGLNGRSA